MIRRSALLFTALILTACAQGLLAAPARPTPRPTPTPFATFTPAFTPTAAVTPPPTASLTPAPTSSATPPATPSPTPVLVVERGELAPGFSLTVCASVPAPSHLA